jgi:hypothetical protein
MALLTNSLEGGTSGTTISNANSGGASGDAFNTVSIGASATLTFDNAHAAHGGLAMKATTPGTATSSFAYWGTSLGAGQGTVWFRAYLYLTANPGVNTRAVTFWTTTSAGTICASVILKTTGTVAFWNSGSSEIIVTTAAVPLNQWFRVEGFCVSSATVGQMELKLFSSMDATVPTETQTSTALQNTGASIGSTGFGPSSSVASITYWMDDVGVSTTGYLGPAASAGAAPLHRPVISRRAPLRARIGRLGLCAAGIASQVVTPLGAPSSPPHRPVIQHCAPERAHTGPRGLCGGGNAGPQPAPALAATAYQRPPPQISRRLPQRAVWRGLASQVVTPRGSPSSPLPRPVIQHPPLDRAHLGPAARPWGGIASAVVTPLGSLQAPRRAVIAPPRNARARLGPAGQPGDGNIGPSATVPVGAQAYQRPPPQVRRPGPARARVGPAGSAGGGVTGPANAAPATAVSPPRLPPQPRRPGPARGQWRGNASRIVTPLGTPARRPGPQITSRPRTRAIWRGIAGTIAPVATALPKWRPLPSRRGPQRARTGGVLGLANAAPPPFTVGALTASGAPAAVLTAAGASSALTAATAPSGTLTAATVPGNALELAPVQDEMLGELFDEAGGQVGA